jgi:hypothetical protein
LLRTNSQARKSRRWVERGRAPHDGIGRCVGRSNQATSRPITTIVQNAAVNGPIDRQISSLSGAEIVIPSRHMCTKDYCLMELDGEFLHRDASRIRRNLSQRTRDDLAKLIGLSQIFDSLAPVANRSQPRG